ncbi:MAG: pseudouridine synthase [Polyangiaceae bacterium]|nr:pseudouridine synthase [Polyangiaceae bacterium]
MSAASVTPLCPHGERCAGCPLLGLSYGGQLEKKGLSVREALGAYRSLARLVPGAAEGASPVLGYRTRAKWVVAPGPRIGMFAKGGGHEVVDVPGCLVASPLLARVAEGLRELLRQGEAFGPWCAPYDGRGPGALKAVDLRQVEGVGSSRALVTLVMERTRAPHPAELGPFAEALAARVPEVVGVALNLSVGSSPQLLGPETRPVWGVTKTTDRVGEIETVASFGAFVQAHRGQATRLQRWALELGRGARRALDLYGGSGAFGLALAQAGARVDLVETLPAAAEAAREAAEAAGLPLRAFAGDAERLLSSFVEAGERYDVVIVNPPRRGLSPGVRRLLGALAPGRLAYVSCEPRTLGRDLDHLARLGLGTQSLRPLDMMPLTEQVECFAALAPASPPPPEVLFENEDIIVVNKAPHEPTAPQGEYLGSLLARVRSLPGCQGAVPVQRHDAGTSGVCLFARRPAAAVAWAAALAAEGAAETYLALVRGVCPPFGTLKRPLSEGARRLEARTRFRRTRAVGGHSLVMATPAQARHHQVRRHLAMCGHPVVGDGRYGEGPTNRHFFEAHGLDRPFLHRARVVLTDSPAGPLTFEAPLAPDLEASLRSLEKAAAAAGGASSSPPPTARESDALAIP